MIYAIPAHGGQFQDGDFSNRLKVTGTGSFEVGVSVKDKQLALEYDNFMTGDGDLEMDPAPSKLRGQPSFLAWPTAQLCR